MYCNVKWRNVTCDIYVDWYSVNRKMTIFGGRRGLNQNGSRDLDYAVVNFQTRTWLAIGQVVEDTTATTFQIGIECEPLATCIWCDMLWIWSEHQCSFLDTGKSWSGFDTLTEKMSKVKFLDFFQNTSFATEKYSSLLLYYIETWKSRKNYGQWMQSFSCIRCRIDIHVFQKLTFLDNLCLQSYATKTLQQIRFNWLGPTFFQLFKVIDHQWALECDTSPCWFH